MPLLIDATKSVAIDKIVTYVANATQTEPQLKQCDICNREGTPVGSFPLRRPRCCKPIHVCSQGHSKSAIVWAFRDRCKNCPLHSRARVAEVEYLSPKLQVRRKWSFTRAKSAEQSKLIDEGSAEHLEHLEHSEQEPSSRSSSGSGSSDMNDDV